MKVSYNWLQNYFEQKLPSPEELVKLLTFHVFEVESVEKFGSDTVLDVKVLPDRARYALSHKGIAYELSAITTISQKLHRNISPEKNSNKTPDASKTKISVSIKDPHACVRYMACAIDGVHVQESPLWLKEYLEAVGQRSINNIVDAANYVMLDIGQPLHAFDADNVEGDIVVRFAKSHERITTLDGKEITLDESVLVIADNIGPLAIAGIKGGNRAAVTESTNHIIVESANFNPSLIRTTTQKIGIRTDSSKRFENKISPDFTREAMEEITVLITELARPKALGNVTDMYPAPVTGWSVHVSSDYIRDRLGVSISNEEISAILKRLLLEHVVFENNFEIHIPTWRGDLMIPEDIVEEVGRIYGYEKIPSVELPHIERSPSLLKGLYYADKIRTVLVQSGFSEVYTYTFVPKGEVTLEKPLAADKAYLRTNLKEGIIQALDINVRNADLLGKDQIKIFEIGNVFLKTEEKRMLALGVKNARKLKVKESETLTETLHALSKELGIDIQNLGKIDGAVFEVDLAKVIASLPEPDHIEKRIIPDPTHVTKYQPFSLYPFSVRDIAVFTPEGTLEQDIEKIIREKAGDLLVRLTLFDVFTKELPGEHPLGGKKTSYAFRLVLQSHEKTLTEDEITTIMNAITSEMNNREGWQVR